MTDERARLWDLHEQVLFQGVELGSVVMANPIAMSGHTLQVVMLAQLDTKLIGKIDAKLDDRRFVETHVYGVGRLQSPRKPKLRWAFEHLDLYLVDEASGTGLSCSAALDVCSSAQALVPGSPTPHIRGYYFGHLREAVGTGKYPFHGVPTSRRALSLESTSLRPLLMDGLKAHVTNNIDASYQRPSANPHN